MKEWYMYVLVLIPAFALVPAGIAIRRKQRIQRQKYYDMTTYMELLLCSFKRCGHIKTALEDCRLVFLEKGMMGQAISRAIHILETGEDTGEGSLTESAFNEISRAYNSKRMRLIHHFLCRVERMGGEAADSLDILLTDLEMWKRRVVLYQKQKQCMGKECTAAALLALLLCEISRFLIPADLQRNFVNSTIYQCSTIVVIYLLTGLLVLVWYYAGRIRPDLMKEKNRKRKIEREFPYWLLSVSLYLQQDSLYHALRQSEKETTGIFRQEVSRLVEGIYQQPTSLQPYLDFFSDLDLPDLRTGMKMLYAVNTNGYQDTKKQIQFLVEQNNAVMDRCEKEYFRMKVSGLRMLRQIPMMLAGGKVMIDMVLFLVLIADRITVF